MILVLPGLLLLARRALGAGSAHSHHQDNHEHDHHDSQHGHTHVLDGDVSLGSLLSMGISGGMVPCPSALVVLLAAVAMHRIVFGLALILAFSLGLAVVLILFGILTVTAARVVGHGATQGRWASILPVVSSGLIMVIGASIAFSSLLSTGVLRR